MNNKKTIKLSDGREVEVDVDANGHWCYIDWEAIKAMTEEEANECFNDLLKTFTDQSNKE